MKRRIFCFSFLLAGFAVLATSVFVTAAAYGNYFASVKREVVSETGYIKAGYEQTGIPYLEAAGARPGCRITLIAANGTVLYDSAKDPAQMDNHLNRVEVSQALESGVDEVIRFSDTLNEQTYYYAIRLDDHTVLRLSRTTNSIYSFFKGLIWLISAIVAAIFLLSAFVASRLTKIIVRPINTLDLQHPANSQIYDELVPLLSRLKRQQEQLAANRTELEDQKTEFSAITDTMHDGFLVLDSGGQVLSYNKSALRLLNSPLANPSGESVFTLNRREEFVRMIQSSFTGAAQEKIIEIAQRDCRVLATPRLEGGAVLGVVVVITDVTEMQEREKLRREFTANVSHELKTPLTAISGYAEIITAGVAKPQDIPEFAQSIYDESRRLFALINDLLFLSRLDENGFVSRESVDLYAVCENVKKQLDHYAAEKDVALAVSGEPALIRGISVVLDEIVFNLMDNAIKYNRPGGKVTVTVSRAAGGCRLSVADTGIGIPRSQCERIFERFYRIDKSRSADIPGTGLGLAIVKHGAMLHGASVKVESDNTGSRFFVTFPFDYAEAIPYPS
ncbi:MAG: PAS domain-containing protein [Peptococcaceae bacterium]|jgi:two-component system phosphate regulon sensor histidine kinase PhoR|nr:PAS domain-containing protein [Peptococcaceae bacterium]